MAFIMISAPAVAQDYKTILDIPEGATLIGLSVTERTEVDQDLLIANLRYEAEDFDRIKVQDEINKAMAAAVKKAERVEDIKFSTQSYHIHSFNPNPRSGQRVEKWRGQQGLQIKGKNPDTLLDLVGDLQADGFAMNGLNYQVSPELMEETKNAMLEDALKKLTVKAERTAKALGKNTANLLQVSVDSGGHHPQPMMMARSTMAMEAAPASMAAPVAAPGQTNITLSVSAQALIKP
jgi:predicted secreted protein